MIAVFTTETSADTPALTSVFTVDSLLFGLGSGVDEVTAAVLVITPVADGDTVPLINIVLVSPAGNVPII